MLAAARTETLCQSCRHCWNVQRAYGCSSGIEGASVLCCDQGGHLPRACAEAHLGHPSSNPQEAWCEEEAFHGESPTPSAPSACKPRHRGVELSSSSQNMLSPPLAWLLASLLFACLHSHPCILTCCTQECTRSTLSVCNWAVRFQV